MQTHFAYTRIVSKTHSLAQHKSAVKNDNNVIIAIKKLIRFKHGPASATWRDDFGRDVFKKKVNLHNLRHI